MSISPTRVQRGLGYRPMEQDQLTVTQKVLATGPYTEAIESGDFAVTLDGDCQTVVNPLLDGTKYLPHTVSRSISGITTTPKRSPSTTGCCGNRFRQTARSDAPVRSGCSIRAHEIFLLAALSHRALSQLRQRLEDQLATTSIKDLATIWLDKRPALHGIMSVMRRSMELTPAQTAQFERDGFLIFPDCSAGGNRGAARSGGFPSTRKRSLASTPAA